MSGMFLSDLHVLTLLTLSCDVGSSIHQYRHLWKLQQREAFLAWVKVYKQQRQDTNPGTHTQMYTYNHQVELPMTFR